LRFLLDTDHISILQKQSGPEFAALAARIGRHPAADLAFSIVSLHEQALGAHNYIAQARDAAKVVVGYRLLGVILRDFAAAPVLPFDAASAALFDDLRSQRVRVATMDLRIASIALAHNPVLLTRNAVDFARVPGLSLDDWTKP
jgi:tRNA(fMet)-specific endonuclease VapC